MPTKSRTDAKNPARDLFGAVPVTVPEVVLWCAVVAHLAPDSPRFAAYVRGWRVVEKIQAAKLAGTWPPAHEKGADESAPAVLLSSLALRRPVPSR